MVCDETRPFPDVPKNSGGSSKSIGNMFLLGVGQVHVITHTCETIKVQAKNCWFQNWVSFAKRHWPCRRGFDVCLTVEATGLG